MNLLLGSFRRFTLEDPVKMTKIITLRGRDYGLDYILYKIPECKETPCNIKTVYCPFKKYWHVIIFDHFTTI